MKLYVSADAVNLFQQLYKYEKNHCFFYSGLNLILNLSHYRYVHDVDIYTAGLAEIKESGTLIGPTFACLASRQFRDLKIGDRFWYETDKEPVSFTPGQLIELKQMTLAKILCRNLMDTPMIQPVAFLSSKLEK